MPSQQNEQQRFEADRKKLEEIARTGGADKTLAWSLHEALDRVSKQLYVAIERSGRGLRHEIETSNGSSLLSYRELADTLQSLSKDLAAAQVGIDAMRAKPSAPDAEAIEQVVASELVDVHRRFDTLAAAIARMEASLDKDRREFLVSIRGNAQSAVRLSRNIFNDTRKIPRVLQTSEATLLVAETAAQAGAKQSRLAETALDMLLEMRAREQPRVSLVPEYEVTQADMMADEPTTGNNVFPIRPARRSALGMVATVALTCATAAFSMSGAPYMEDDRLPMECVEDPTRTDVYDCGTGHLWVATKKTPNANGGVDLDLKPYKE